MINELIKTCKFIAFTTEDLDYLNANFGNYSCEIIDGNNLEYINSVPTIIIGWSFVKNKFPNQSILYKNINENLCWTYSLLEDEKEIKKDCIDFLNNSIDNFFNKKIISYDAIIDGSLKDFLSENINSKIRSFIYFHKNACYIHNENRICVISISSLEFIEKDYKSILTSLINKIPCTLFSYYNASNYTHLEHLRDVMTLENIFWTKYYFYIEPKVFSESFLGRNVHRFIPLLMKIIYENHEITKEELNSCKRQTKKDKITSWMSTNRIYFDKKYKSPENLKTSWENSQIYTILRYSDKRTITGRINCVDSFNPQMIAKEDKFRKAFISRYKLGKIVVFDYKSFETRLSMYISRDEEFILSNINSDLHLNTAKKIFSTDTISDKERDVAKSINHSILYGGGDALIKKILTDAKVEDVEKILLVIKEYLSPIFDVSNYINGVYKELGYIINPFGTIIRPNKTYAAFNNYIQSTAADIVADKLLVIKEYIKDKNISFMFQVYDSFIFDFSEDSLIYIQELKDILSKYNDMRFDIESYIGENYGELRLFKK